MGMTLEDLYYLSQHPVNSAVGTMREFRNSLSTAFPTINAPPQQSQRQQQLATPTARVSIPPMTEEERKKKARELYSRSNLHQAEQLYLLNNNL